MGTWTEFWHCILQLTTKTWLGPYQLWNIIVLGYVVSQARLASLKGKGLLNCMYKLCPIGMQNFFDTFSDSLNHTHALISEPWIVRALWPVIAPPDWKCLPTQKWCPYKRSWVVFMPVCANVLRNDPASVTKAVLEPAKDKPGIVECALVLFAAREFSSIKACFGQ